MTACSKGVEGCREGVLTHGLHANPRSLDEMSNSDLLEAIVSFVAAHSDANLFMEHLGVLRLRLWNLEERS